MLQLHPQTVNGKVHQIDPIRGLAARCALRRAGADGWEVRPVQQDRDGKLEWADELHETDMVGLRPWRQESRLQFRPSRSQRRPTRR